MLKLALQALSLVSMSVPRRSASSSLQLLSSPSVHPRAFTTKVRGHGGETLRDLQIIYIHEDSFLPSAAAICRLNFNLCVGAMPTACFPRSHTNQTSPQQLPRTNNHVVLLKNRFLMASKNLISHFFLLALSVAPNCIIIVLKSTPSVSTPVASPTPSLLRHS